MSAVNILTVAIAVVSIIAAVAAWRPDVCLAGIAVIYGLSAPVARLVTALLPRRHAPAPGAPE